MASIPARAAYQRFIAGSLEGRPIALVVHASPTVRHALFVTLDLDGFDVLVARDAAEAVVLLADEQPKVVVAELTAGGAGLGDLLRRLRSDATTMHIPVILISRDGATPPVRKWIEDGVQHVRLDDGVDRLLDLLHVTVDSLRGRV